MAGGKNAFLEKQRIANQTYFDAVLQMGRQQIAKIYGEGMHDTFHERYEFCKEFDYTKGKWK